MQRTTEQKELVSWLREASPYVHAHRGRVFVVYLSGEAVSAAGFEHHIYDLALLSSLGIRIVLVHGIRPQLEARLAAAGIDSILVDDVRVTDAAAMPHVVDACGTVRARIEARLSQGVINSPMSGAQLRVGSGNFVTARPVGVLGGVDFAFTGETRRVDSEAIRRRLDDGEIVLVSPLAHSPSGESFNLDAATLAADIAVALSATKLVFLSEFGALKLIDGEVLHELAATEADKARPTLAEESKGQFDRALRAATKGVGRVHVIDHAIDGALLLELFSRDGVGSLISATPFDEVRKATPDDVSAIISLIEPLEAKGVLVRRSRDLIEREIDCFFVVTRDGSVVACAAIHVLANADAAELACLAVDPQYTQRGFGEALLRRLEEAARKLGVSQVFLLTTQAQDWFREQGFADASKDDLPVARRECYNEQRNSKVLTKRL